MHEILARIAETTPDPFLRHTALDLQLTLPPLKDWSDEQRRALSERYAFIALLPEAEGSTSHL